ncbi:MAG TPA: pantoate--beta-alanine ligase [Candidatus Acidoferrales bacterium]|nr:pantoate--beta-alanine ligase [Candidatus Acidoferrales bacterium]
MEQVADLERARAIFAASPRPLGFVPTMGALHAGHLELVAAARRRCASVATSIFVNPLQFGPNEDLTRYPRDLDADARKLAEAGVDTLFAPPDSAMYPPGFAVSVDPGPAGDCFEGAVRPGHFRGVATVIVKLLNIVRPDRLFLGQKDAQQTVVLRRTIADLDFGVRLEVVPTVREADGLAMSSRNAYLDAAQRAQAPTLHSALVAMREALERGEAREDAIAAGRARLSESAKLDYLDVVDADSFQPLERLRVPAFVIGAARFGTTRLIDNLWIRP